MKKSVLIVGAGSGLSASLAKLFHKEDMAICLAARNVAKLGVLSQKTGAFLLQCDTSKPKEVANLFKFSDENISQKAKDISVAPILLGVDFNVDPMSAVCAVKDSDTEIDTR